jgi:hypothetical protein
MTSGRPVRRGPRIFVALLLLVAMAGLYGTLVTRLTADARSTTATLDAQREAVAYLRPLSILQSELVSARFSAVRGQRVDVEALSVAVAGVTEADRTHGTAVGSVQRWSDLRAALDHVLAASPSGRPALQAYNDVLALTAGLSQQVAAANHLIAQEDLDGHYLAESVSIGVPRIVETAGLAADEAYLSTTPDEKGGRGELVMRVALARYQVARTADDVRAGVRIALSTTASTTLAAVINGPLDRLNNAIGELTAPTAVPPETAAFDAAALAGGAMSIRVAGAALTGTILAGLDELVTIRLHQEWVDGVWAWGAAIAGGLVGLVLLWWSVPAAVTRSPDEDGDATDRDVAAISMRLPEIDPRDLLESEELVHVGRGVRAQHRAQDDHAE